ncbi:MAG: hypothetical protein II669_00590 [Elusimicrobia bacterium]|nr:hypothetical protein [Elusimicrobiota bacterium]
MKKAPCYVLLSTINAAVNGWTAYCKGTNEQCEATLSNNPIFRGTDIWADTYRKNAIIVSMTTAKRKYHYDPYF